MWTPDEIKLLCRPYEEIEKYSTLDKDGHIVGVKDDAPIDFKQDFIDYQKHCAKCEAEGID